MVIELLETSEETTTKMQCLTEESGCQRGHPKTQTMQTADCRLQTVQTVHTVQTVQTMQTE